MVIMCKKIENIYIFSLIHIKYFIFYISYFILFWIINGKYEKYIEIYKKR